MQSFSEAKEKRIRTGLFAGVFGIITNLLAFGVKAAAGAVSGSLGIVADAANSLTDALSSVITVAGFRLSAKPADKDHPYGHARYEQIAALVISMIMFTVGLTFAKSSVEKIIRPSETVFGVLTYISLGAAVVLKIIQSAVNYALSRRIDSGALRASALDSRNDVLITLTVIAGVIINDVFDVMIDGWSGLAVSLFIIVSAASSIKSAISPMLGAPPPESLVKELVGIVMSRPEILGYHDLRIHNYGSGANFASIHAEIDSRDEIVAIHDVIDGIEHEVESKLGVVLTIHMDPVNAEKGEVENEDSKTQEG